MEPSDPSSRDMLAGFRYSFQLIERDQGLISGTLSSSFDEASSSNSFEFSLPDDGEYVLIARIFDQQNGFRDYFRNITTLNEAPEESWKGQLQSHRGRHLLTSLLHPTCPQMISPRSGIQLRYAKAIFKLSIRKLVIAEVLY